MDGNGYHRQADEEDTGEEQLKPVEPKNVWTGAYEIPKYLKNMKMDMEAFVSF